MNNTTKQLSKMLHDIKVMKLDFDHTLLTNQKDFKGLESLTEDTRNYIAKVSTYIELLLWGINRPPDCKG